MIARHIRGILAVAGLCASSFLHAQVAAPLQVVSDVLPAASVGAQYYQQIVTTGGACISNGNATSTIDSGSLPPGISVTSPSSTEQWFLQGVPLAAGNFSFTVHLTWTHVRASPFQALDCRDDAIKSLTMVVQGGTGPNPATVLTADRPQLTATYRIPHFPPIADTVQVTAPGNAAVTFGVQSVTDSGGPWLSVVAQRYTTPTAITVGYAVSGLATGTYTGRVIFTMGSDTALTIPVTLQVVTDTNIVLQPTPLSLAFSMVAGGADPPSQPLRVTVTGGDVLFQAMVSAAAPNGKWLSVAPTATATPTTLTVSVTGKDLTAGVYTGTLTLAVGGSGSQIVPVTLTIQAPTKKPVISTGGVVNAAGLGSATAPGTWVSLFGTALSTTTRAWRDTDFQNSRLPTALDGVSVTINGKSAAVAFISPLQINVLAPDDTATGLVPVQVRNALGASDSVLVLQQTAAPALFQLRTATANYATGTHADGSLLAGPALVQLGYSGTAAKVGETIVVFGTGFGATQPAISATALVPAPLPLARPEDLRVRIGGLDAAIAWAGLISPGVYQFNVVVPQVPEGDRSIVAELRGLLTQPDLLLTIQR